MSPEGFDDYPHEEQEAAELLLQRVALRLLGEARLRGNFGEDDEIRERAVALIDEMTDGAPAPDPRRAKVEAVSIRPDRISLTIPFAPARTIQESLTIDGILYDGGGTVSIVATATTDLETLNADERAELERRREEWAARRARSERFTATRFVRAVAPPPHPGAAMSVLAILLYEDGFYLEATYEKGESPVSEPDGLGVRSSALPFDDEPKFMVTDDVGTEYFESGDASWGGGMIVFDASVGFAPAPPSEARILNVAIGDTSVQFDLRP